MITGTAMPDTDRLFTIALVAAAVLAAAYMAAMAVAVALRRRARRARNRRGAEADAHQAARERLVAASMTRDRAAAISRDAEEAARDVAGGGRSVAVNPHPLRTREYVLWEATYLSTLSDFAELSDDAAVQDASLSRPPALPDARPTGQ